MPRKPGEQFMKQRKIVKDWLVSHGYNCLIGDECGCYVDDLMPCGDGMCPWECRAGHKTNNNKCRGGG